LNVLGLTVYGNPALSLRAMQNLAVTPGSPQSDPYALSERFAAEALAAIRQQLDLLLEEINAQPVYTIRELLVSEALRPCQAVFIGGPAQALAAKMEEALGLPVFAPEKSACANAVGAALAQPTLAAELYADTLLGRMSIPEFGVEKEIGSSYALADAEKDMREAFAGICDKDPSFAAEGFSCPAGTAENTVRAMQTVYAESFAMLDDQRRRGRTVRLRAQLAAGLLKRAC
jgi:hypothetical protein